MTADEIFLLPVHPAANAFAMLPDDELDDLADDIKLNGLNHPITIRNGQLVDGRNRREACRRAGVIPTVIELPAKKNIEAYVWSENSQRRHITQSARAMAFALMFPDPASAAERGAKGGRGRKALSPGQSFSMEMVSKARTVLQEFTKHSPVIEQIKRGGSLRQAYEEVQTRQAQRKARDEQIDRMRTRYPEYAEKVTGGEWSLNKALSVIAQVEIREDQLRIRDKKRQELQLMIESLGPESDTPLVIKPVVDPITVDFDQELASIEHASSQVDKHGDARRDLLASVIGIHHRLQELVRKSVIEEGGFLSESFDAAVRSGCQNIIQQAQELGTKYTRELRAKIRQVK